MNISPRNQTLLLASERRVQVGQNPSGTLGRALDAASSGGILKRLTIVASRPDDELVYVQADYATTGDQSVAEQTSPSRPGTSLALTTRAVTDEPRDAYGNTLSRSRDPGLSSHLPPAEQYARTQRNWSSTTTLGLDVHA